MFRQNEQQVFNNFGIQVSLAICRVLRYTIGEPRGQRTKIALLTPAVHYNTDTTGCGYADYLPH